MSGFLFFMNEATDWSNGRKEVLLLIEHFVIFIYLLYGLSLVIRFRIFNFVWLDVLGDVFDEFLNVLIDNLFLNIELLRCFFFFYRDILYYKYVWWVWLIYFVNKLVLKMTDFNIFKVTIYIYFWLKLKLTFY